MIRYDGQDLGGGHYLKCTAPVLEIGEDGKKYPNGENLPNIWITEPVFDSENNYLGRTYTNYYEANNDPDGSLALYYGAEYYNEAMTYTTQKDHKARVECFQAAEILYRHSAGAGNPYACLNLGYIYSYDRCEGWYWGYFEDDTDEARKARAFDYLSQAAKADIAEACYKLGDMYKRGMGCKPDAKRAFECYSRAAELCDEENESPVIFGSTALRLGDCFEVGFGCTQSFADALKWYKQAVTALEIAIRGGESWYSRALTGAKDGVKRCQQEVGF